MVIQDAPRGRAGKAQLRTVSRFALDLGEGSRLVLEQIFLGRPLPGDGPESDFWRSAALATFFAVTLTLAPPYVIMRR